MGSASMSDSIEDPVVVKPDTDSNKALVKEGIEPDNTYGRHPTRLINTHVIVTVKKASFRLSFNSLKSFLPEIIENNKPVNKASEELIMKCIILSW